ncbi:MAG TPA: HAMP domain-containing sensor histidine kinase [Cyclobacteriaceae bacterium]|nr:HAMP domain-containing sensor histidine kinase [Cyclobacteriaceae bacterium]
MTTHEKMSSEIYDTGQISSVTGHELTKTKDAIEQFIYSCSHSLRGPLKTITSLVNLIKDTKGNAEADPQLFLDCIVKTVEKMEFLLNDLELSNSHQTMATQSIDIDQVIHTILNEYNSIIQNEGINVTVRLEQQVPFHGDANRFNVILSQLIANAIHFRDPKKDVMTIQIHVEVLPSICTVQIRDNGIGISDAIRPNIFNLFYRGSEKSVGTGIGLYIVKEVLNKMGGTIILKSIEHKESTFRVSIPNLVA